MGANRKRVIQRIMGGGETGTTGATFGVGKDEGVSLGERG